MLWDNEPRYFFKKIAQRKYEKQRKIDRFIYHQNVDSLPLAIITSLTWSTNYDQSDQSTEINHQLFDHDKVQHSTWSLIVSESREKARDSGKSICVFLGRARSSNVGDVYLKDFYGFIPWIKNKTYRIAKRKLISFCRRKQIIPRNLEAV